MNLQDVGGFE